MLTEVGSTPVLMLTERASESILNSAIAERNGHIAKRASGLIMPIEVSHLYKALSTPSTQEPTGARVPAVAVFLLHVSF